MASNLELIPFVDLSWQHQPLQEEIELAMLKVAQRGDFILGKEVKELETNFAHASGVKYGIGVASGTDAIALGLKACGIQPEDEVIVPANTFIATVIGVIQAGAKPILVDCQPNTALIDLSEAQKVVTPKTKAILPVHLYGQMVSPQALQDFASAHNLIIFEDAAQAHLAYREEQTAGSIGKAAAFSFYPSKNLGAFGNGGMLITDDENVAESMRSLRNYGAPKKYYHSELGTNSRLDTLQAAVLQIKLPYLRDWNNWRNQAAKQYDQLLAPLAEQGLKPIKNLSAQGHIYHLYVIQVEPRSTISRDSLQTKLAEINIQTGIHYPIPCHLQPAYRYLGYQEGDFPQAERLCRNILSLPIYPGISAAQIERVCEQITNIVNNLANNRLYLIV
jgi:dTDP-4-amino-4,6-dideoxygalactose transaminase